MTALAAGAVESPAVAGAEPGTPGSRPGEPLAAAPAAGASVEEEEQEEEALRDRLTERPDRRRVPEPWTRTLGGNPLTVEGEIELELTGTRRRTFAASVREPDRLLLESGLEIETFYTVGPALSLFAQIRAGLEEDLLGGDPGAVSARFAERGETWAYTERIAGLPLSFEVGSLHFEDDRRWWWDGELDAARLTFGGDTLEVQAAFAREIAPRRLDRGRIAPEEEGVGRVLVEASWDWSASHALQLFLLRASDRSRTQPLGAVVRSARMDESDGRLTWLGLRATGVAPFPNGASFGYWLDAAMVRGTEDELAFEDVASGTREVVDRQRRRVRGWAIDAGLQGILALPADPRVFVGYAFGSGDPQSGDRHDRAFRQTGLEANEAGFGGVERFAHYGVLLDPELSNLHILLVGAGVSLLRNSSLDLVYHHYRLDEPAGSLRSAHLDAELTGRTRDLGHALDVVLGVEEWVHLELTVIGSLFRAGKAFGPEHGRWSAGAYLSVRVPF